MREILFRGKRVDNGEWVFGDFVTNGCGIAYTDYLNEHGDFGEVFRKVLPETVGQYTGLTDKNGTKIFEGDIIRYGFLYDYECYLESLEHPEEYDNEIYDQDIKVSAVEWCLELDYPAFDLADHDFECNGLSQIMCGDYECEVIGNIHDNPELMKGGAE